MDIKELSVYDSSVFEKIDEVLYGHDKIENVKDKVEWVCNNFEKVARELKDASRN